MTLRENQQFAHSSRKSSVFYWKSANLVGSVTVLYTPIENDRARGDLLGVVLLIFGLKVPNNVRFGL